MSKDFLFAQYKAGVYGNLFTGIVYGAYVVVYVFAIYVLLSKPGFTSSRPRMFMFGITTFMFALGIIALALQTTLDLQRAIIIFHNSGSFDFNSYYIQQYVWATTTCLMYIICDAICAWRTVILWNKDKRVIAILAFFILATAGAAVCSLYFDLIQGAYPKDEYLTVGKLDLVVVCPTLSTNLLSTGLIGWKAWQRRVSVREHLREGSRLVRVDRVFALLIESGLIYCCIWILYWIAKSGMLPDPGFTIIAFFSGLCPTLIIVLVSKQMSPVDHYSIHSAEMQFARVPASGIPNLKDGSTPRHVFTIHREYLSDSDTQIPSTVSMKIPEEEMSL